MEYQALARSRRAARRVSASARGWEMGRIRLTSVFERADESRMPPTEVNLLIHGAPQIVPSPVKRSFSEARHFSCSDSAPPAL
jgi:hypothetical protein